MSKASTDRTKKTVVPHGVTKRLQVAFPLEDIPALQQVAVLTGQSTLSGVLRDAFRVYSWLLAQQQQAYRIVAEDMTGQHRTELAPLLKVERL
jgi:hypothetical protein